MGKINKRLTEAMEIDSELSSLRESLTEAIDRDVYKRLREEAWDEEVEKHKPVKITFAVEVNIQQAYVVAKMSGSVKLTHEASCDIADARQGRFEFSEGGKEQK